MGLVCWLMGHKHDSDWIANNSMVVHTERNMMLHGKKIGTVKCGFKVLFCKRCNAVFHEKDVVEEFE